jgi:hypothetical protein
LPDAAGAFVTVVTLSFRLIVRDGNIYTCDFDGNNYQLFITSSDGYVHVFLRFFAVLIIANRGYLDLWIDEANQYLYFVDQVGSAKVIRRADLATGGNIIDILNGM